MTPHKQLFRHDPDNGIYGDCFRTAIACMLDLPVEEVPHFNHDNPGGIIGWERVQKWLAPRGLTIYACAYSSSVEDVLATFGETNPGMYAMIVGQSPRGTNHNVIALNGKIIHDTAIDGGGLVGPCDDGYVWINLLVPVNIHIRKGS